MKNRQKEQNKECKEEIAIESEEIFKLSWHNFIQSLDEILKPR